jgi:hypothetical protein
MPEKVYAPVFNKKHRMFLGTLHDGSRCYVQVELNNDDGRVELHVIGDVYGPYGLNEGGQCRETIQMVTNYAPGWDADLVMVLMAIWRQYHLNRTHAGCFHQRLLNWNHGHIGKTCPVCGYKYGHEWKDERLPTDVLAYVGFLQATYPNTSAH